ncbi:hypothetical protein DWV05_01170 [Weissella thailandensis]|uniref:Uncharacterized protein n=1 Tax=Weissella thailandensis TaxID=89061 RepID=A0ABX9I7S4_9LACO|nr:hypothetical protein DWV05_01170 [Weissella thailandensis]
MRKVIITTTIFLAVFVGGSLFLVIIIHIKKYMAAPKKVGKIYHFIFNLIRWISINLCVV